MLRIAICDDDSKFTGEIETLVFQESRKPKYSPMAKPF